MYCLTGDGADGAEFGETGFISREGVCETLGEAQTEGCRIAGFAPCVTAAGGALTGRSTRDGVCAVLGEARVEGCRGLAGGMIAVEGALCDRSVPGVSATVGLLGMKGATGRRSG